MRRHLGRGGARTVALLLGCIVATAGCTLPDDGTGDTDAPTQTTQVETAATTTEVVDARQIYIVRSGDTMVRIAARFDIDLNALVKENGIADPTRIFVGQQLFIPPPPDEQRGPVRTLPPPTRPDLPPVLPTTSLPEDDDTAETSGDVGNGADDAEGGSDPSPAGG